MNAYLDSKKVTQVFEESWDELTQEYPKARTIPTSLCILFTFFDKSLFSSVFKP